MATWLDLIADSLTDIGQLGEGQSPSAEQIQRGKRYLQRMLDQWSAQRFYLFSIATRPFVMTPALQDYSLGPSAAGPGSFVGARPVFVEAAQVMLPGSAMTHPLNPLDSIKWGAIRDKGATCSANGIPQDIWVDMQYPNIVFHLWTIPANACTVILRTWEILQQIVTEFDTISLPPGYQAAIQPNLSMALCSAYDMPVPQALAMLAANGLRVISQVNAQAFGGSMGESQTLQSANLSLPPPTGAQPTPGGGPA